MTVGSLFSGIGGIDLGLEWAGFETRWFCEIDPAARAVLRKHWPGVPIINNIRDVTAGAVSGVDILAGGFPCQDLSFSGLGAGIDYDLAVGNGTRSGLWWEMWRVTRLLEPKYVFVENVAALAHRGLDVVLGSLSDIGYDAEWTLIPASSMGAPHGRDRIFLVAYPGRERSQVQAAGQLPAVEVLGSYGAAWRTGAPDWFGGGWSAPWPVVAQNWRMANGVPGRLERLKMIGNSVVPQIAYLVGLAIMKHSARP